MFGTIIHKWLRVPYALYVTKQKSVGRSRATIVFLHGIGNSGESWERVIAGLPKDVTAITIDLLGYGNSARPTWAKYNVRTQARSVIRTLIGLGLSGKVILVGHSLGSLVAIEVTKRYPVIVKSLVLCSPPLYDTEKDKIRLVTAALNQIKRNPKRFVKLSEIARKYGLVNKSFRLTSESVQTYMETLQASILTQSSLDDAVKIKKPITLIYGSADPWVKKRNLVRVSKQNAKATLTTTSAGHEIRGLYPKVVVRAIKQQILPPKKSK